MFTIKIHQNRVYLPKALRDTLKVRDTDEIIFEVNVIANNKIVTVKKNVLKGVRILSTSKEV